MTAMNRTKENNLVWADPGPSTRDHEHRAGAGPSPALSGEYGHHAGADPGPMSVNYHGRE